MAMPMMMMLVVVVPMTTLWSLLHNRIKSVVSNSIFRHISPLSKLLAVRQVYRSVVQKVLAVFNFTKRQNGDSGGRSCRKARRRRLIEFAYISIERVMGIMLTLVRWGHGSGCIVACHWLLLRMDGIQSLPFSDRRLLKNNARLANRSITRNIHAESTYSIA